MALKDTFFQTFLDHINNEDEKLFYRDKVVEQINETTKEEAKLEWYLILTILAYFFIKKSETLSLQIGPFSLTDLEIATAVIPPLYTYLVIGIFTTYNFIQIQKNNLERIVSSSDQVNENELKSIISILIPFNIGQIFNYFDLEKSRKASLLNAFLLIPLIFSLPLIMFGIEIFWVYELYQNWDVNWIFKVSLILTLWLLTIFLTMLFIAAKNSIENIRNSKKQED